MTININGTTGISGVNGSATTPAIQGDNDPNTGISFGTDEVNIVTGGTTRATVDANGDFSVNTDVLFVDASAGNVGIGQSSVTQFGTAYRTVELKNTDGGAIRFMDGSSTANSNDSLVYHNTSGLYLRANGSRDVNIWAGGSERVKINFNGSLNVPGVYNDTTANAANVWVNSNGDIARSTSSKKYKTSIETIEDSYSNALLSCRPVWYRSTCESDNPEHGWWGFIAEEVAEIDPRLVFWKTVDITYDEKGSVVETPCEPEPEGVAYDRFVPHLLNLIKRQQERIETLETVNAEQATTIASFEARISALEGGN